MDKQRWQRAEQLFYQAVELSAAQRDAFIRQACQQDAALEAGMEAMSEEFRAQGAEVYHKA